MSEKINILATWSDPESKFKRLTQSLQTTVSRFPTYEPCPEHEHFDFSAVSGYKPILTPDDKTYQGSTSAGNSQTTPPPAVNSGSNNTSVTGDSATDDSVTKNLNINALRNQLIVHEGYKNTVYIDTKNLLHGGVGHLLRQNEITQYPIGSPLSDEQIEIWFTQDSKTAIKIGQTLLGDTWFSLSDIRKRAIADLAYNLGQSRLSKFVKFISSMKSEDFKQAGQALRNSTWFSQVGKRGPNIVTMIVQDIDPTRSDKKF